MNAIKISSSSSPIATLDLAGETPGRAVEAADGVWVIATEHRPGFSRHMFPINNRVVVFRVRDRRTGKPVLVVANGADPEQSVSEVKRIERETGLAVRAIVSPGGGHHLTLADWHDRFPEAEVLIPPLRIPNTPNGKKLLTLPRVRKMDLANPLPELAGELDVVIFHGLLGPPDMPTPVEGGSDSLWSFVRHMMKAMPPREPADEVWIHHAPSATVLAGENLAWQYPAAAHRKLPFMGKRMLKADRVWIWSSFRKVGDEAVVAECWRRILAWPARTLMTYHDVPGTCFRGDGQAALRQAVRDCGQLPG